MPSVHWLYSSALLPFCWAVSMECGDMTAPSGLYEFVNFPRRPCYDTVFVLDSIFSNCDRLVTSVFPVLGISDHQAVLAQISYRRATLIKGRPHELFVYEKGNYHFIAHCLVVPYDVFSATKNTLNTNEIWVLFRNKLLALIDKRVPSKVLSTK